MNPLSDPTVLILWGVTSVLVAFVVLRGLRATTWGGVSTPRLNPVSAAQGVIGGLFGLAFAALYFMSRVRESAARLRAVELQGGEISPEAIASSALPFSAEDEAIRYASLGTGVVFLVFVLAALMPLALDLLEGRSFVTFVAARHVRASKSGFLTVISVLSILGVCVSSCALCAVTSIMGGFGHDLKSKILSNNAHVIVDEKSPGGFQDWQRGVDALNSELGKDGAATPIVSGDAMSSSATNTAGVLVKGIDLDSIGKVIDLPNNIEAGKFSYLTDLEGLANIPDGTVICRLPDGTPRRKQPDFVLSEDPSEATALHYAAKPKNPVRAGVILGRELAKSLHVCVGDEITLLSPMGELGPMGVMPRTRKFRVAAIFYSAMYEYDVTHAYITLADAQSFFSMEDKITEIDVRVSEPEAVEKFSGRIEHAVAAAYEPSKRPDNAPRAPALRSRDWKEMNKNLFSALKLERVATFVVLGLCILVATFCIICTLLLMVTEKTRQIAILKAVGASNGAISRIFVIEGVIIGALGTIFGVGIALAMCTGLQWFGARLPPEVYYIDRLPINVDLVDYAIVVVSAIVLCTLATLYPSYEAGRIAPVDGLRHE